MTATSLEDGSSTNGNASSVATSKKLSGCPTSPNGQHHWILGMPVKNLTKGTCKHCQGNRVWDIEESMIISPFER